MKISCYGHRDWPGVDAAMRNLSEVLKCSYPEELDPNVDLLILGGYAPGHHDGWIRAGKGAGAKVALYWTSSLGQAGLEDEWANLGKCLIMLGRGDIDYLFAGDGKVAGPLWCSHPDVASKIHVIPFPLAYWNYPFNVDHYSQNIVFLTPKRSYKNVTNQLVALSILAKMLPNLQFYVNSLLSHSSIVAQIMFPFPFKYSDWMDQKEYSQLLSTASLSLQATYCETCNYAAMEALAYGTPTLLSFAPEWAKRIQNEEVKRYIIDRELDDPVMLARKMYDLLQYPAESYLFREEIIRIADENNAKVCVVIEDLV